jgi:PAS domain S-box-containing protein
MTSEIGHIQRAGALAVFLVSTVVIILGAWTAFTHYRAELLRTKQEDLLAIAQLKQSRIRESLHERMADAEVFAARRPVVAALDPKAPAGLRAESRLQLPAAIDLTVRSYRYRRIVILDKDANTVFPADAAPPESAAMEAIGRTRETHKPTIVDLHRTDLGEMAYGIVAPVNDGKNEAALLGFVYLQADANTKLYTNALGWPTPSASGESILVRRDGDHVVWVSPLRHRRDVAPLDQKMPIADEHLLAAKALRGQTGIINDVVDYRGVEVVATALPVDGTPWILIAKMDRDEVERDIDRLIHVIVVLAGVFIIIAAGVTLLIWRSSRMEVLEEQAELASQYEAAIETTTDGFLRVDRNARVVEVNRALSQMTQYPESELLDMELQQLEGAETPEETTEHLTAIRKAGSARFQTQWRRKDGTLIDIDVSTVFVRTSAGEFYYAYMRDITESLDLTRRLKRMNAFYAFLIHVTEELTNLRRPEEILGAVCRTGVLDGIFELAWAGIIDHEAGNVRIVAAEGAATDYVKSLNITLDPALPTSRGATGLAIRERRTIEINDFQNDPRTAPWLERARIHNIHASAATPVMIGERVVGVLHVCANERGYFDRNILMLLEETAHNIGLAWEAGEATRDRDTERGMREQSEERFRRIFDASPLPKQIHSKTTGDLVSINKAHEELFGYPLHEIRGDAWPEKVYEDPVFRKQIYDEWRRDIQIVADTGRTMPSPEMQLRCRDGSTRTVRGYMTVVGEDVIIAWVDLTEFRKAEAAVVASESRFRGMVEQTVTGFYVVRGSQLLYVNPAFAQMVGWSPEELTGKNPLDFLDEESRAVAVKSAESMTAGASTVGYTVRVKRKDGGFVTLGINGTRALWDGKPALVAMAEDITERTRAEEKVRQSLQRLEKSMAGTLNAVARMVDLRDPYTAGHQRRVGVISADIARELGWAEDRCRTMEMIGLVHDIGKIAVPAEILSKPSRLTPLEFEMIKAHAQASQDILNDVEFDIPVGEIIGQHHERLDGSGYPKGLKGDEILPEARILAVADVLESMASHRPYRAALGVDAALGELTSKKGTHFDTAIVEAAVRMVREKNYQLPK